jgi:hypothetical protein
VKLFFHILQIVTLIWIGYWVYQWSATKITDPNGTSHFNKNLVREYMFSRAAEHEKLPIIIDAISDTQKIKLHGEELLTSAVSVQGDGLAHYTMYFVTAPTGGNYLSGGADLLKDIDKIGFEEEGKKVDEKMKEQAEADTNAKLAEADAKTNEPRDPPLTRDPSLSIEAQAQSDANAYYFKNNGKKIVANSSEIYNYAHRRAEQLGLTRHGDDSDYAIAFEKALEKYQTDR